MRKTKTIALLLLSLPSFVVLKPVKDVFALDLPELTKLSRDLFDLLGIWSSHSSPVQRLQYPYLLLRWIPPRPSRVGFNLHPHKKNKNHLKLLGSLAIYIFLLL